MPASRVRVGIAATGGAMSPDAVEVYPIAAKSPVRQGRQPFRIGSPAHAGINLARAADAATVRIEYAAGVRTIEAIAISAVPRWRLIRTCQPDIDLPGPTHDTLPAITRTRPLPLRAAVIEAWSAPAEPSIRRCSGACG